MEAEARTESLDAKGATEFYATYPDALLQPPQGTTVVAAIDDHCVGFATLLFSRAGGSTTALITRMFVTASARQVGVGDALIAAARTTANEHGCVWLDALALPGDRATKNLYERNGLTARLLVASTHL
jgi:GNAT superfamily N-acetyltransferase